MGHKDIVSKSLFKNLVRDLAVHLLGLPVTEVELLDAEQQRIEERRADLVARVTVPGRPPFILHIEIQNDNQAIMPVRMLRYLSDILQAHPDLPVRQYLVYIGKPPLAMPDGLALPLFTYRYDVLDMHRVDCRSLLERDSPDAWVLAILCDFKGWTPREVVHTILTQLAERFRDQPPRLREYVEMLDILASNRDLNINIREELNMLTIDVEKLATYQMGREQGFNQGMERGIEKGIEKGMEAGAHREALAIARKMLEKGQSPAWIASVTDLPVAEIEGLWRASGDKSTSA